MTIRFLPLPALGSGRLLYEKISTMPLFKRSPTPPPFPVQEQETGPPRKRVGIFSSSRAADNAETTALDTRTTPPNDNGTTTGTSRIGGFFRRRSTGSAEVDSTRHSRRGSVGPGTALAGRSGRGGDRQLEAARYKVTLAEKAEKEADA
jgi:hypothetical protein